MNADKADVLIVGGGPAGLATAIALRQKGASVTVADAMTPPIDKACGEGLMPDSLQDLAALGVSLSPQDGETFRGIRFIDPKVSAVARFPSSSGLGLNRRVLHERMVTRARDAGVDLRWKCPVQLPAARGALVAGEPFLCRWLIGADGQASQVRSWAHLERGKIVSRRFGFRQHFEVHPWTDHVEVHWAASGQAYVTPTGPNEVCIAAVVRNPRCRLSDLLADLPALREKLGVAPWRVLDRERGALTATRRLARVAIDTIALVGDASGSTDAITGEGLGVAFRQAALLADCLSQEDLSRYNRDHRQTLQLPHLMAKMMLWMDQSTAFRSRALAMLAADPSIFERLLGVHLGAESVPHFLLARGLHVAARLVAPGHLDPVAGRKLFESHQ